MPFSLSPLLAFQAFFFITAQCNVPVIASHLTTDGYLRRRQANSSTSSSVSENLIAPASATTCANDCTVCAANPVIYSWTPYTITGTIIAATVVEIVNTADDITRTTTIFNDLPSDYTYPPTNADGTQTRLVTYTRSGITSTIDVAFPTNFMAWGDGYTWSGTLFTDSSCETASESSYVPFASYPQPPVTKSTRTDGILDQEGILFKPTDGYGLMSSYVATYTDIPALQSCSTCPLPLPAQNALTVRFMTATTTSYEGSSVVGGADTGPSKPPPTPTTSVNAYTGPSKPPPTPTTSVNAYTGPSKPPPTPTTPVNVYTVVTKGPSGTSSIIITGTQAPAPTGGSAPANNLYTTVIDWSSGTSTILAISGQLSPDQATAGNVYTIVINGPGGLTTITGISTAQATSPGPGVSYTVVQTGSAGTSTIVVVGAPVSETAGSTTSASGGLQGSGAERTRLWSMIWILALPWVSFWILVAS